MKGMKKFELTTDSKILFGRKLFRIKALVSFGNVGAGDIGGFVEKEENLSQDGDAWVYGNAMVYGNARVSGNAWVYGNARVYGNAWVYGNARVSGNAMVSDNVDYTTIKGFGSEFRNTTFFKCKDGKVRTQCGCFYGTLDEFREKVKQTHGESKFAKEYLMIADLMEYHFKGDDEE